MIGMNNIGDSLVIGPKFNLPKDLLEENRIDWIKYMQIILRKYTSSWHKWIIS